MSFVLAVLAGAMPLPPPRQIVPGYREIPESRTAPIIPWQDRIFPAVAWTCQLNIVGRAARTIDISGSFHESNGVAPLDRFAWAPYTTVEIRQNDTHNFEGVFLTTISPQAYGFSFAFEGDAYEITIRRVQDEAQGIIELRRWSPSIDRNWTQLGTGTCTFGAENQVSAN